MIRNIETKICGLSTPQSLDAVIRGGAAHAGFIFFEKSPRHISLEQAAALANHVDNRISKVAVTVNADDAYLDEIIAALKPDMLQLHGSETLERVNEVKSRYGLPIMKALAIREKSDLEAVKQYQEIVDRFLFDAKPPEGSSLPGGNGVAFDWEIMDHLPQNVPYMLSGGLDIANVMEAIEKSGASAIDVSSGVETAPGKKDVNRIAEFLDRIRGSQGTRY